MPPAPAELLTWAAGPAALYLAASAVGPWLARRAAANPVRLVRWWQSAHLGQLLATVLQFGFYVGIPYAGVVTGALDLHSLGLTGADTPGTVALVALVTTTSLALFGGARRYWAGGSQAVDVLAPSTLEPAAPAPSGWQSLIDTAAVAVALQAHLALYRAALLPAAGADLLPAAAAALAAFAALALVALERAAGALLAGRWEAPGAARGDIESLATMASGAIVLWGANSLPGAVVVQAAVAFGLSRLRDH